MSNKWRICSQTFSSSDTSIINTWYTHIKQKLAELKGRPRSLLLFINPFGGKQKAEKLYKKYIKPMFELASIEVNVVISQRPNHMRDIIVTETLNEFDGIVCIGGDGTFSEVFNGLLLRTINDLGNAIKINSLMKFN